MLAPLALAALVAVVPVMGFRLGWQRLLSHPAGAHVRVVTLNADGGDLIAPRLARLLLEWEPDIITLQECGDELKDATTKVPGWHQHDVRHLCFLSRFPIIDTKVMDRSALERVHVDEDLGIGGTGDVARYTLQTPSGPVSVTNLHLETARKGLESLRSESVDFYRMESNTALRAIESKLARKWVDGGAGPTIVAGDFNTPVESRIFQSYWGDLTDAWSRAGFGFGMTKNNGWIRIRIDHVLSGPGWHVDSIAIGRDIGSDHLPLIVDLTLAPDK